MNKEELKEYNRQYREENIEKIKIREKEYYENNKCKKNEYNKLWYKENEQKRKEYMKEYREKNKENMKEYIKNRRNNDPLYKITGNIRNLIRQSIKNQGYTKKSRTYEILGIDYKGFKEYIENQFKSWMTWENHGKYNGELNFGWDLDHIKPISSAKNEDEVIKLNHYTNFQPLCSKINRDIKKNNF